MRLRFPHSARLTEAGEFARMKRDGRSFPGRFVVLSVLAREGDETPARLGIITTKRIGGAVVRNRVRRRWREIFRAARPRLRPGLWLVLIARAPSTKAAFQELQGEWERLGKRGDIFLTPCSS